MSEFDAVIVGAGHNGLAAAIHLATKGWKVAVVETKPTAGGAVKTEELIEPGFRHDLCAMNLSMFAGSAFHQLYAGDLAAHGLKFVPAPHCFASVFPDGTHLGIGTDAAANRSAIAALSSRDAESFASMSSAFGTMAPHLFGLLGAPMPSFASVKTVWKAWRAGGLPLLHDLLRLLMSSPRGFLDRHFDNEKLKAMMAAWGLHLDFPPDAAGGALFPYLETMTNQAFGMVIGSGGADTIIKAMSGLLLAKGGTLLLNAPVQSIELSQGRAKTVVLCDGRRLTARKAVISNVHPKILFGGMVPAASLPARFSEGLKAYRSGPGAMMIHLTLDRLPDWAASPALKSYAYVHIAPNLSMMNRVYDEAISGLLPREPALVVGQPTALDPSRAPDGKHVLWVQVRVLPADIKGDAAGEITVTDWASAKEAYADRVLKIIEAYAPGLGGLVRGRSVWSPVDLERENPNLIGGDSLSGSHHLDQNFLFRPVAGYSRYKSPIDGLYMCGAATWPGAGTGAGSGFLLARMLAG
ncbi:phytoene desaturase family protein [Rhizobium alvei]|uniref:Pyridine nucleotide-disulfide oxidoreductase domain-containing protein 2 n=1 Tax=Rhizobium alvei TaxID=1132659 RepID=A0ABT8YMR8_9HYPH|nr:NAD(P)/FAD-dependent oxidoreductase [Rhizobium alvei]MDO6965030.1 NAD(P)/FAD-dependent oxidoreductase [Rhizobium alvei]